MAAINRSVISGARIAGYSSGCGVSFEGIKIRNSLGKTLSVKPLKK